MIDRLPPIPFYIRVTDSYEDQRLMERLLDLLEKLNWKNNIGAAGYRKFLRDSLAVQIVLNVDSTGRYTNGLLDVNRDRPVIPIEEAFALITPNSF